MSSTQDQILRRTLQWRSADPHRTPYYAAMEKALEWNAAQILKKKKCFEQLKRVVTSWQGRSLDVSQVIDPQGQNKKTRVLSASYVE